MEESRMKNQRFFTQRFVFLCCLPQSRLYTESNTEMGIKMKQKHFIWITFFFLFTTILILPQKVNAYTEDEAKTVMTFSEIVSKKNTSSKKYVTRAEFASMLVQASPFRGEMKKNKNVQLFTDVSKTQKYSPYIQLAVSKGYMSGYLRGQFQPEKPIILREAIYGVLQLLGYKKEDFMGNPSYARYETYQELGLSEHLSLSEGDTLTITDCSYLFYNLLKAKTKEGAVYGERFGYSFLDNGDIDIEKLQKKYIKGPFIIKGNWKKQLPIELKNFQIYINGKISKLKTLPNYSIVYFSTQQKKLWVYDKKRYGIVENVKREQGKLQELTISNQSYLVDVKNSKKVLSDNTIVPGKPIMVLLGSEDTIVSILPIEVSLFKSKQKNTFPSNLTVYKNGIVSNLSSLENNDVIYYVKALKTIWSYNKKIYGTVEEIKKEKGDIQQITIANESYSVNLKQFSSKSNSLKQKITQGKRVVLLLGLDDTVVQVLPIDIHLFQTKNNTISSYTTIYKNDIKSTASSLKANDIIYYSKSLETIWAYNKKIYGFIEDIKKEKGSIQQLTVAGQTYSVDMNQIPKHLLGKNIKTGIPTVLLFGADDMVVGILPMQTALFDSNSNVNFSSNTTVYKNGTLSSLSLLEQNDVIYYSTFLKTLWSYNKKEYGTVEKITPNQTTPEEISVAGKTYSLKNIPVSHISKDANFFDKNVWGTHLIQNGIQEGSRVILLLGHQNTIVDIILEEQLPTTLTGYLLKVEQKAIKDSQNVLTVKTIVKFVDTNGTIREVPTIDKNLSRGDIIQVNFESGEAKITKIYPDLLSTNINKVIKKQFASTIKVLDINDESYSKISPEKLNNISIIASDIAYYSLNTQGEISELILKNKTNRLYQYGILKSVKIIDSDEEISSNQIGDFTLEIEGKEYIYNTSILNQDISIGPKKFLIEHGTLKEVKPIYGISIAYISGKQVNTGTSVHNISDTASIYLYNNGNYYPIALSDISDLSLYRLRGYTENWNESAGEIKLLIAEKI